MLLNEGKILSNYILSLKEHIGILQKIIGHSPTSERFAELNTLMIVRDDLQEILNNHKGYKTYWICFGEVGKCTKI